MVALTKDERGITVITFVLVFPIFILIIFGMFEVWKIISVRESLHLGMRRVAARLTKEGRRDLPDWWEGWEAEAEIRTKETVTQELTNNPFVPDNVAIQAEVRIYDHDLPKCKWLFTARVEIPWTAVIPYIPGTMTLAEQTTSYIRCTKYEIP